MHYVVMGVSGCGKSSVGSAVAQAIGATFIDGDDLHPPANITKMSNGIPLDDADRLPWLRAVGDCLGRATTSTVIACSALKRHYRDTIRGQAGGQVTFLYLAGSADIIAERVRARQGHFMPPALLASQFSALVPPQSDERAITVNIDQPFADVLRAFTDAIQAAD